MSVEVAGVVGDLPLRGRLLLHGVDHGVLLLDALYREQPLLGTAPPSRMEFVASIAKFRYRCAACLSPSSA